MIQKQVFVDYREINMISVNKFCMIDFSKDLTMKEILWSATTRPSKTRGN